MNNKIERIKNNTAIKVVFTDLFDTVIHRVVHPLYVYKIWAKLLIGELAIPSSIHQLYQIRSSAIKKLSEDLACSIVEIPYDTLVKEMYNRLINSNLIENIDYENFFQCFKEADFLAEKDVQFINKEIIDGLKFLKGDSYKIYAVSDFHLPVSTIKKLLEYHGILDVFDDVFISCEFQKSKESGNLYDVVLELTNSRPDETAMIGDDKTNDFINAAANGLFAQHLKHSNHKFRNKKNLFGSSNKEFIKICREVEKKCNASEHPFSEYIINFYFFTERLYKECRKKGVKNLFFLAREGHYLKELFDRYQQFNAILDKDKINTHYFKASRHSAMQVSLQPLPIEEFAFFRKKYGKMSARDFMVPFEIPEDQMTQISGDANVDLDKVIVDFVSSDTLAKLRKNNLLNRFYDSHRIKQKAAFESYLSSFGVDFEKEGISVVDVGWGGTMQEGIFNYFNGKIDVTGYYIGLKEIYDIQSKTKRFGLNFSVYPKIDYSDHILMANGQLYEQLLAAPHGSTLGYTIDSDSPTIEFHEPNEKKVFDEFINSIQIFMTSQFDVLNKNLKRCAYNDSMVQDYLTDLALRMGLFTNNKKLKFIQRISQGFYQNVGGNQVGIAYDPSLLKTSKFGLLKRFIWSPEKVFRYLVKVKPHLYNNGYSWLGWPVNLSFYYIKFNNWIKKRFFKKGLL